MSFSLQPRPLIVVVAYLNWERHHIPVPSQFALRFQSVVILMIQETNTET